MRGLSVEYRPARILPCTRHVRGRNSRPLQTSYPSCKVRRKKAHWQVSQLVPHTHSKDMGTVSSLRTVTDALSTWHITLLCVPVLDLPVVDGLGGVRARAAGLAATCLTRAVPDRQHACAIMRQSKKERCCYEVCGVYRMRIFRKRR